MSILNINKYFSILVLFHFFEIALMGSGRLLELGPLTLRMYLFVLIIILTLFNLTKFNKSVLFSFLLFLLSLFFGFIIGILKGKSTPLIFEDIKPLLFYFEIFFLYHLINEQHDIELKFYNIYKYTGVILSFLFFILLSLFFFEKINFFSFYEWALEQNDFIFRPNDNSISSIGFFYKGFIFIGVSFFFFLENKNRLNYLILIILSLALILTLTRGLILSAIITLFIYLFKKNKGKFLLYITILTTVFFFSYSIYLTIIGNKDESNSIRIEDTMFIFQNISISNIIFGNGFGSLINNRSSVENSFLDIFFNQGLLGLSFYLYLFYRIIYIYNTKLKYNKNLSPFFYGSIFIFFESLTNPFINNPIGISFIMVTFSIFEKNNLKYNSHKLNSI